LHTNAHLLEIQTSNH